MTAPTGRTSQRRAEHRDPTAKKPTTGAAEKSVDGATTMAQIDKPRSPGKPNSHAIARPTLESETRTKLVREAAYFRAERRGFGPGGEIEDWVAAERQVDQMLAANGIAKG